VNIDVYYDGFLIQMQRAKTEGIVYDDLSHYFDAADNVEDALAYCVDEVARIRSMHSDD
jgi:hypothetical protein